MVSFPSLLKSWRARRRFSQLSLAHAAQVSPRHVAFLETGRAGPSVEMVERLSDALEVPLGARNQLLTSAGYAARYPAHAWDSAALAPLRAAVDRMLERHAPYPGLALDRAWRVVQLNEPARRLFGQHFREGDSLLERMVDGRFRDLVENWPDVARAAALRLRTESNAQGGVLELDRAAEALSSFAVSSAAESSRATPSSRSPVVPTILRVGSQRLRLFATLAEFGTPEDLTVADLRVELYFPLDAASAEILAALG